LRILASLGAKLGVNLPPESSIFRS
jgi:hypothetical protein